MFSNADSTSRFFKIITARPIVALLISLTLIAASASGLSRLVKDTSVKAFIPPDHPALLADEHAAEVFGLSNSIAIAVVTRDGSSIFTAPTLNLIRQLTTDIGQLPNVRSDRVTSLATEASISGKDGVVDVLPYIARIVGKLNRAQGFIFGKVVQRQRRRR